MTESGLDSDMAGKAQTWQNQPYVPDRAVQDVGKAAALLRAAEETGLLAALEQRAPRHDREGLSVARYLFLQFMGRGEKPLSRDGMEAWFPSYAFPLLWHTRARTSSRTLLRYLQRLTATGKSTAEGKAVLTPATIHRIEEDVLRTIRAQGLSLDKLLVDTTNFFTYHRDGGLHRKGHSEERRYDKTLLGLGLVTTGSIPILSELFPGNDTDPSVFHRVFEELNPLQGRVFSAFHLGEMIPQKARRPLGRQKRYSGYVIHAEEKQQVSDSGPRDAKPPQTAFLLTPSRSSETVAESPIPLTSLVLGVRVTVGVLG